MTPKTTYTNVVFYLSVFKIGYLDSICCINVDPPISIQFSKTEGEYIRYSIPYVKTPARNMSQVINNETFIKLREEALPEVSDGYVFN